jgi:hypothetical protein
MDPYVAGGCYFADITQPHVLNQCNCANSISIMSADTMSLYTQLREAINQEFYDGLFDTTIDSCQAQNQALVWLSSGNTRDAGDIYQRYVLAVTYMQMNGTAWKNSTKWLSDVNECNWYGIECNKTTFQISTINLNANNVWGRIPSEISQLRAVSAISLSNNQLSGTIPTEIVSLPTIEHVMLSNNRMIGSIPSYLVSSESKLQTINFDNNSLFGTIPSWIRNATGLSTLSLSNNDFSGTIPTDINSANMEKLLLHNNKFTGTFPADSFANDFAGKSKLKEVTLYNNDIKGDLEEMCNLALTGKLEVLEVDLDKVTCTCCAGPP